MDYKKVFQKIFPLGEFPRVRSSDPATSHQAAASITDVRSHYAQILEALSTIGPLGKDGISFYSKLDPNQIARRLNEMQKLGLIRLTGKTVKSNSNRQEREWTI
ncbi:hypothetical protein UFOVP626_55 [uncultured Caudovirales phage]|uniref:Uncharacterized protein n=3 Tax=uncultured Caudovirales phage TaxID=2100421 RepID=A0A6J7XRM3_9CAUD|nr:hypothetical protein UFOVP626_55 [uncultured Caudovirales phage]CAB4173351.1 hypothetical protein UFOVP951_50 [uncultured Caudovirales phage]CAB4184830.1 hypothetical protein UFOVP1115_41 [uncultured Caudovirales phage]CAB5238427.1 hypothetical protein UFOVP1567_40 [uncultured Caudovirales phage]